MSTIKTIKNSFGKYNIEFYDSADEVVADCKTRKRTDSSFYDMRNHNIHDDWHGVNSYDEALELLKNGYQDTVDDFKAEIKSQKTTGTQKRIQFENHIAGFAPIVPLALKGVPNAMINMTMKPIKCKVLDVYYDMTANCGVEPERIIQNGRAILGAIMELEKKGYRFNLYAIQTYCDDGGRSADILCVKVKASDRPLDLKRISFPLTHPAFFRVIGFDWYSKMPIAKYRSGYGRGLGYELGNGQMKKFAEETFGKNATYLCGAKMLTDREHLKEVLTNDKSKD